MSPSPATVASAAAVEEGTSQRAKPPRPTPALWVPRVDSLAEFGLMISRQLTQCRRYGGRLSVLWLEAEPATGPTTVLAAPGAADAVAADAAAAAQAAVIEARMELTKAVGRRLRSRVRGTDMVLQVGESSFAVLLLDAGLSEARLVQQRLSAGLNGPYGVDAATMHVRLQMGSASFPEGGVRGADLAESARQDLRRRVV
ncbi:diguanylate cyclase [Mitsuaria sp. GD03876]|uniref:diguanylate cyclase domain-containing protein n=1 Tax=Mitsuaria sp. GD03876 TaxID=2975399 RepID=UPI002446E5A8|nr:diguanylate cyclase [Mitsuaria sp. GD03876]MDH0863750.1 diguanylate cyclase [Mitsuaria sp. GD03876]